MGLGSPANLFAGRPLAWYFRRHSQPKAGLFNLSPHNTPVLLHILSRHTTVEGLPLQQIDSNDSRNLNGRSCESLRRLCTAGLQGT